MKWFLMDKGKLTAKETGGGAIAGRRKVRPGEKGHWLAAGGACTLV